jgi:hypothetical protein
MITYDGSHILLIAWESRGGGRVMQSIASLCGASKVSHAERNVESDPGLCSAASRRWTAAK